MYCKYIMFIDLQFAIFLVNCRYWNHHFNYENSYETKQKLKLKDDVSYYIDDLDIPFIRVKSRYPVPSVGHGADIKFGQILPLLKKMAMPQHFNAMDSIKEAMKKKGKK